jgi:hypothetical protein
MLHHKLPNAMHVLLCESTKKMLENMKEGLNSTLTSNSTLNSSFRTRRPCLERALIETQRFLTYEIILDRRVLCRNHIVIERYKEKWSSTYTHPPRSRSRCKCLRTNERITIQG